MEVYGKARAMGSDFERKALLCHSRRGFHTVCISPVVALGVSGLQDGCCGKNACTMASSNGIICLLISQIQQDLDGSVPKGQTRYVAVPA